MDRESSGYFFCFFLMFRCSDGNTSLLFFVCMCVCVRCVGHGYAGRDGTKEQRVQAESIHW